MSTENLSIQELVQREPWRLNQGQPHTALDPAWSSQEPRELCDGEAHFEERGGRLTGWWFCKTCGFCSNAHTLLHRVAQNPIDYYEKSLKFFFKQRSEQGLPESVAKLQATFIAGVALRYAATVPHERLVRFVQENLIVR